MNAVILSVSEESYIFSRTLVFFFINLILKNELSVKNKIKNIAAQVAIRKMLYETLK